MQRDIDTENLSNYLGTGKRLFVEGTFPATFRVSTSPVSPTGVIVTNLEPVGKVQSGITV